MAPLRAILKSLELLHVRIETKMSQAFFKNNGHKKSVRRKVNSLASLSTGTQEDRKSSSSKSELSPKLKRIKSHTLLGGAELCT